MYELDVTIDGRHDIMCNISAVSCFGWYVPCQRWVQHLQTVLICIMRTPQEDQLWVLVINQLKKTKKQPCIGRRAKRAPANDLRASLRTQRLVWLAQSSQFLFADTGQNRRSGDDASLRNAPAVNGASARRQVRVPRVPWAMGPWVLQGRLWRAAGVAGSSSMFFEEKK